MYVHSIIKGGRYSSVLFQNKNCFLMKTLVFGHIRCYSEVPILNLYEKVTGQMVTKDLLLNWKKKHPKIDCLSDQRLQCTLEILQKFGITAADACHNLHIFCMNPITMDNYGEILRECGFNIVIPKHIIRYHTLVRSHTISQLKKEGLLRDDLNLEEVLHSCFQEWPENDWQLQKFSDSGTSILAVRKSVLQRYLQWRLYITNEEFEKYCKNYLPLRHRPMCDIKEALNIAQNDIKFDVGNIRRNGFIISSDPTNTKLILENVHSLAGLDIREVIRIEPAILKNNYNAILEIKKCLEEYCITEEAQRKCLKVYCMSPLSVQERLQQLMDLKEYQVLSSNPRVLYMVVHKKKMISRLEKIQVEKKHCYSLNHLVSSNKIFNTYINSFGNKACGRDIGILICTSLQINTNQYNLSESDIRKTIMNRLRRHKYWLHTALYVVNDNITFLKRTFDDHVIYNNCQILLYPIAEIEQYIEFFTKMRNGDKTRKESLDVDMDTSYNNLNYNLLTDNQLLSLVLYEIEKKYHFSGDGIWNKQEIKGHQIRRNY